MKLSKLKKGKIAYIKAIDPEVQEQLYNYGIIPDVSIELIHKTKTTHSVFKIDNNSEVILDDRILKLVDVYLSSNDKKCIPLL